jgi:hypothetical protein
MAKIHVFTALKTEAIIGLRMSLAVNIGAASK